MRGSKKFSLPSFFRIVRAIGTIRRQVTPQSLHTEKQMSAELDVHSQEYVTQVHGSKALGAQPYGPTFQ